MSQVQVVQIDREYQTNDRCDREESESYIGSILNNSFSGAGGVSPRPRVVMLSLRFAVRLSRCLGAGAPGAGCWMEETSSEAAILVLLNLPRKEVIQPHLPVRLPCYDFTPLTLHTFDASAPRRGSAGGFGCRRLGWCDGRCVQGPGTHSPRRADPRLLATPASRRRVAASDPNWGRLCGIRSPSRGGNPLCRPL